jgi:ABC-type branched-subunit amino acid transport system permease subunit
MRRPSPSTLLTIVACLAAAAAPLVLTDLTFLVRTVLAAIVVTGLSLLMGYAGQASLGQGAFVAAGALTVALGTTRFDLPPLAALLCAPWWPAPSPPWSAYPCCACTATTWPSAPSPCC